MMGSSRCTLLFLQYSQAAVSNELCVVANGPVHFIHLQVAMVDMVVVMPALTCPVHNQTHFSKKMHVRHALPVNTACHLYLPMTPVVKPARTGNLRLREAPIVKYVKVAIR